MRLRVVVDDWEVGCCLDPPQVGAQVVWTLRLAEAVPLWHEPEHLHRLHGSARVLPASAGTTTGTWPVALHVGAAHLHWEAAQPVIEGPVAVQGTVHLAHHGEAPEDFPATSATISRVRIAATMYEERPPGSRSWRPVVPLDVLYRDVDRSPEHLSSDPTWSPARLTNALLVDLEVAG